MSQSDDVRDYCRAHYVEPARQKGEHTVTIRAGDVHTQMGLKDRLPAVCSALGSRMFEDVAGMRRIAVDGPINGSSVLFVYVLRNDVEEL